MVVDGALTPPGATLVVAAHPDDDVLGCGGTIARLAQVGHRVVLSFATDGVGARGSDRAAAQRRRDAARAAAAVLGVEDLRFGGWPDNQLDTVPLLSLSQHVEALIAEISPRLVLTHHPGDLNVDHRMMCQAAATACRPQPGHPVRDLWSFEVASSTEWQVPGGQRAAFTPNLFVDISTTLSQKIRALETYADEARPWPHARSTEAVTALARWRGATAGVDAAEAFMVQRMMR